MGLSLFVTRRCCCQDAGVDKIMFLLLKLVSSSLVACAANKMLLLTRCGFSFSL